VLNTTVTLTGSSQIALARNPRGTAVARRTAPPPGSADQAYASTNVGDPVVLTPQPQYLPGRRLVPPPQERQDDGYIYPADGSSDQQIYPAPRSSRPLSGAQVYQQPQPQYYGNGGYAQPPQGYYQPRPSYPPRGGYYYQN
jgi:hypothetical protein